MWSGLSGGTDSSLDEDDDLVEIRERFKELTKEKEMLRDSKSQSFDLIRRLEFHVKTLSESRAEYKRRVADLERELSNCGQEIDYLQDQLNLTDSDLSCPGEQICLHSNLSDTENLAAEVRRLREQLKISESERLLLVQELEDKEVVMRYSESHVEKLEESISSMALEYQCEIESMKLESISLEQNLFETKKLLAEKAQEYSKLTELIHDLQVRNLDANKVIESLEKENNDLKEKLQRSNTCNEAFIKKVEEQFHELLRKKDNPSLSKLEKDMSTNGTILGTLLSKIAIPKASDADLRSLMAEMSRQIDDYELLVRQLKEDVREERLKAKEEAEDLAQEMAELRYQLTLMLDEECKRRANVEQISVQRIAELEAQIAKERQKSTSSQDLVIRNQ